MLTFWILLALLTCAATAAVVWPLLGRRSADAARNADEAARLAVYRDRRREIERERDAGRLSPQEAGRALDDLVAEAALLLPDADAGPGPQAGAAPRRRGVLPWAICSALVIPAVAIGIYALIGSPAIVGMDAATLRGEFSPQRLEQAVAELSEQVKRRPEDGEAWAMLAEAQRLQARPIEAAEAYAKAIDLLPPNARLLADYAETLVLIGHGNFAGLPLQLLTRALQVDPNDGKAVALMGAAQYRLGNLDEALRHLKKLSGQLPEGSDEAAQLEAAIARIEEERAAGGGAPAGTRGDAPAANGPAVGGSAAGAPAASTPSAGAPSAAPPSAAAPSAAAPSAAAPSATAPTAAAPTAPAAAAISGVVGIDDALRADLGPGAVLFITARDPDGPRIPLAALRIPVGQWPVAFTLGDAQAMDPARPLSKAARVVIEARISASGDAMRRSGDPIGSSEPLQPGARDVALRIDRRVP